MKTKYEIQQDNAGNYRVIRTGPDGIRRAWDNPPCKTKSEAREVIRQAKAEDRESEQPEQTLPDPASEGAWHWTRDDIDKVLAELGRRFARREFNPKTWAGKPLEGFELSSGKHDIDPMYFGYVYAKWCKKYPCPVCGQSSTQPDQEQP